MIVFPYLSGQLVSLYPCPSINEYMPLKNILSCKVTMRSLPFLYKEDWSNEDLEKRLSDWNNKAKASKATLFLVKENKKNIVIGDAGFYEIDNEKKTLGLGCIIGYKFHNHGYGTEIIFLLMQYAFEHLKFKKAFFKTTQDNNLINILKNKFGIEPLALEKKVPILNDSLKVDLLAYEFLDYNWPKFKQLLIGHLNKKRI